MNLIAESKFSLRFAALNIIFSLYALFIQPLILPFLQDTANRGYTGSNYFAGALILSALAFEAPALYYRLGQIGQRILARRPKSAGTSIEIPYFFLLVILHAGLGVMVMMFAFRSFGFGFHTDEWMFRLFFLLALAREGVIIYLLFSRKVPETPESPNMMKSILADAGILMFTCVTFTATWEVIPPAVNHDASLLMSLVLFFFSGILFLMFYLPCNMAYLVEDLLLLRGARDKFMRITALAVVVISAVGPYSFHGVLHAGSDREALIQRAEMEEAAGKRTMSERILMEKLKHSESRAGRQPLPSH